MRKMKSKLSLLLALAMIVTTLSMGMVSVSAAAFQDTEGHWAQEAIDKWSGYGVIQGNDGLFRPQDNITRAETATVLNNVISYTEAAENTFTDVENGAWYADAILKANKAGVINGYGEGIMNPTANVSREETVVMISRAVGLAAINNSSMDFSDRGQISDWADGYVGAMVAGGYIQGSDGMFRPGDPITRAEFVTILNNLVGLYITEAGTYDGSYLNIVVVKAAGTTLQGVNAKGVVISPLVGSGTVNLNTCNISGNLTNLAPGASVNKNASIVNSESKPTATSKPTTSINGGGNSGSGTGTTTYRVTLDANGGTIRGGSSIYRDITRNMAFGSIEAPVRNGYTFVAWYNTKSPDPDTDQDKIWNLKTDRVTRPLTLYAGWKVDSDKTFTVSFETNGAAAIAPITKIAYDDVISEPKEPTRKDWKFEGWYTDKALKQKYNFSNKVTEDFTLYAKWSLASSADEDKVVNVAFDTNEKPKDVQTAEAYPSEALPGETVRIDVELKSSASVAVSGIEVTYNKKQEGTDPVKATITATKAGDSYTFEVPDDAADQSFTFKVLTADLYEVTVNKATNGKVEVDKAKAAKDDTVTITLTPDKGFEADAVTVAGTNPVTAEKQANGTYTFTMPAEKVTVTATFKESTEEAAAVSNVAVEVSGEAVNVSFDVDKGFEFNDYGFSETGDALNTKITKLYTDLLTGTDAEKAAAAEAIGNDVIVVYYKADDVQGTNKAVLQTKDENPLVKNKLWGGYLNYMDGNNAIPLVGTGANDTYLGDSLLAGKSWITTTSPATDAVAAGWLNGAASVYVEVIVVNNGNVSTAHAGAAVPTAE